MADPLSPDAPDFPAVDAAAWRARVEAELGDAPFDDSLVGRSDEGLAVAPVYPPARAPAAPLLRSRAWRLAPRVCCADPVRGNTELLADLRGGAGALWLGSDLLSLASADAARLLQDVRAAAIEVHVDSNTAPAQVLTLLAESGGVAALRGCLGGDPLGAWTRRGAPTDLDAEWDALADGVRRCLADAPSLRAIGLSSEAVSDGGGHAVQELAFLLASTAATWRALDARGVAPSDAAGQTVWRLTVGRDTFGALATLRAARRLHRRFASACGAVGDALEPQLHAVCARRTLTRLDPWTNLLRTTTQVWAALLGGADLVTPTAWDEALGRPSRSARRLARNTALVLAEEGMLDAVADPAAGSGFFEARTEDLAAAAWREFQRIETADGLDASLTDGSLQEAVAQSARARAARFACGQDAVLGVSAFPPQHADVLAAQERARAEAERWPDGAALPAADGDAASRQGAIPLRRDAADIEEDRA